MFRMTIGAGRRVTLSLRGGVAMHAGSHILRFLIMTLTAGLPLAREMQRRNGRNGREHLMGVMTMLARVRIRAACLQSQPVHARAITLGLALMTDAAIDRLGGEVVIRMFDRDIGMTTGASVGSVRRAGQLRWIDKEGNR